ncbi:hypothetical protein ACP8HI_14785 [Paenibacillus sp. FA6]|uniref:hypothetical protein n=1 Tax=Paenibacillus sp. FA6 TaxID=3413029 RepID=UPI003F65C29C
MIPAFSAWEIAFLAKESSMSAKVVGLSSYVSGSGTTDLVFTHTLREGYYGEGITVPPNLLLNASTIVDTNQQTYDGTLTGIPVTRVDIMHTVSAIAASLCFNSLNMCSSHKMNLFSPTFAGKCATVLRSCLF